MSEPKKTTIIHQIAIDTDDHPDSQTTPQVLIENASSQNTLNGSRFSGSKQLSQKAKTRTIEANVESITLQESVPKSQPLPLKASFLRRKAKEYEGKPYLCA